MSGEPPKKTKDSRAEFQSAIAHLKEAAGKRRAMDRDGFFGPTPDKKAVADAELSAAIAYVRGFPQYPLLEVLQNAEDALRESQKKFNCTDTLMRTPPVNSFEADALERVHRTFRTKLETDKAFVAAMECVLNRSGRKSHLMY